MTQEQITIHAPIKMGSAIASVQWSKGKTFFVSDLPGHIGDKRVAAGAERNSDWGYVSDRSKALPLSSYWQRRFNADSRRCNRTARFEPI